MDNLATLISTVGFPIVSFLISAFFIKYTFDAQMIKDKECNDREEKHWEEISKLTQAVNNNTEVLRDLVKTSLKE